MGLVNFLSAVKRSSGNSDLTMAQRSSERQRIILQLSNLLSYAILAAGILGYAVRDEDACEGKVESTTQVSGSWPRPLKSLAGHGIRILTAYLQRL